MKRIVGVSSYSIFDFSIDKMVDFVETHKFGAAELWLEDFGGSAQGLRNLCRLVDKGVKLSIHAPIMNLGETARREENMAMLLQTIQTAKEYRSDTIVLHIGEVSNSAGRDADQPISNVVRLLKEVEPFLGDMIQLCIENVGYLEQEFITSFDQLKELIEAINSVRVRVAFDAAHANVNGGVEEGLALLQPYIRHFHISDNTGDVKNHHQPVGTGDINFDGVKMHMDKYNAAAILEIRPESDWVETLLMSRKKIMT